MAQIIEDYCPFETSKLLKEKGFDVPSFKPEEWLFCMYDEQGKLHWGAYSDNWYCRVTLQMAMKWLREVHNLVIEPYRTACGYLYTISSIPYGSNKYDNSDAFDGDDEASGQWTTWEKACEDGIKYCLEKLI